MRKMREVLRLRFGLGLHQNQIARSCSLGQATVHRYLHKAAAAGLGGPLPEDLDDRRLEELLFPAAAGRPSQAMRSVPDFAEIRRQLPTHKHLTLQLIWEEYRETQPEGYGYSRFCELYERWSRNHGCGAAPEAPRRLRRCSWTGPATASRSMTSAPARSRRSGYSSALWAPARTPLRAPR
jgi:hypothetical protein